MEIKMLDAFFKNWRNVSLEKETNTKNIVIPSSTAMEKFFDNYQPIYQEKEIQMQNGLMLNVWEAANLGRNEVRNSKTLRWFLDRYAKHGQKDLFLSEFLKCLPEPWCSISIGNYWAIEECCPLGEQTERVDIEIDADNFLLFIEVKIDAFEGEKQLERYYETAKAKSKGRPFGIIYLTRDGILPEFYSNKPEFCGLSWGELANHWQKFTKKALEENPNNRAIWLAEQFVYHILAF
ncbi:PD-(D/E)XK nuclease family protein [Mannheimia sp. AT1]|uniref:PD-(D/E)XK nuclease family protein n=1 Tax=Mannheimia cairinae TaxID=3025936 RepID=A0ABT5MNW7_9PAST|nr:PD-(D/E)XK nuclease family protein [Mannheimia cairinae]MDD0823176.1 PD-(D/E)XK nuclease family protein [Mannheimia cairinae]MDD0825799.1 PD-(D/E)XK nuclease family protein [Mannheimia cairinae]